jgi:hypothetical protein
MPEEIAKQVLGKYFGPAWVANPTGTHFGTIPALKCGRDTPYPMSIRSLTYLQVAQAGGGKVLTVYRQFSPSLTCGEQVRYTIRRDVPYSQEEINDMVDAFVSLGAQIKEMR